VSDDSDIERSTDFARPWRISSLDESFPCRYGRRSRAILDANNRVVVLIDPSANEYEPACTMEAAEAIVEALK